MYILQGGLTVIHRTVFKRNEFPVREYAGSRMSDVSPGERYRDCLLRNDVNRRGAPVKKAVVSSPGAFMTDENNISQSEVTGLLLGLGIGLVVGLLVQPQSSGGSRRTLRDEQAGLSSMPHNRTWSQEGLRNASPATQAL